MNWKQQALASLMSDIIACGKARHHLVDEGKL